MVSGGDGPNADLRAQGPEDFVLQPIHDYRLAEPPGDGAPRPLRTPLQYSDGRDTGSAVPGFVLLHQFRVGVETLLITDWDCPYEEATEVMLLDAAHRLVARRSFGAMYSSWALREVEVVDATRLRLDFHGGPRVRIAVRDAAPWWSPAAWRSRLAVETVLD